MSLIYLAEIDGYFVEAATVKTLRFSSGLGFYDETNPMNGVFYEPRIEQPALASYEMLNDLKIAGRSTVGYGELTLINIDGGLDYFNAYAFDGRSIVIKAGDENAAYSSFVTVFNGLIASVVIGYSRVSVRLKDKIEQLERPLQTVLYAGNNALPDGIEGDSSLTGRPKPLAYGKPKNVTPVLINTSRLIYQVCSQAVGAIPKVYDKGVELTYGGAYTSQSDMETNAPAAGHFNVWLAGGMFRLGSAAAGGITCDVTATAQNLSDIITALLTSDNGIEVTDIVTSDFSGISAMSFIVDLYVDQITTIAEALDAVCSAALVSWWFDHLGQFRTAQLEMPSIGSVATLTTDEIISIESNPAIIDSKPYPVWNIRLGYEKNWTVQTGDQLASSVSSDRKAWLEREYRYINSPAPSIKTIFLLAQDITVDTPLSSLTNANYQASLLEVLWQDRTVFLDVAVVVDVNLLNVLKLNSVVTLQMNRFGLSSVGMPFRIIAIKTDYQKNQLDLKLWGLL